VTIGHRYADPTDQPPSRRRRGDIDVISRRAIIGVVLAAAIPLLSSCGLEVKEETSREKSPVQATDFSVGPVEIRDAFVTYDQSSGIQPLASNPAGAPGAGDAGTGYVVVTLVNNGRRIDYFTGATSPLGAITPQTSLSVPGSVNSPLGFKLLPGIPVEFGAPSVGSTGAMLRIAGGGTPAAVGTEVRVTFNFRNAGSATVQVPVVDSQNITVDPRQTVPVPTSTETLPSEGLKPASD
jgi:copper(I)-binding protein